MENGVKVDMWTEKVTVKREGTAKARKTSPNNMRKTWAVTCMGGPQPVRIGKDGYSDIHKSLQHVHACRPRP